MKNSWIFPVAALAVGAAGGYISGKNSDTADAKAPGVEQSAQRTRTTSRSEATGSGETTKKSRAGSTEQIAKMPGNSTRIQALLEFYGGLSAEQLAEEAGKLEGLPMNERLMASFLLFGRWAEVDPTAAMSFSSTMGGAGNFVRPTILQSWASVDPAGAAKYYAENPREFAMMGGFAGMGRGGQGGAGVIAAEWARQDPAAALAWASSLTVDKGQAMTSVIGEIAKTDPRKASEMIGKMDEADRAGAYRTVAAQYGALDFGEAQSWIRSLPAADQAAALASAIGGLSNNDPAAAAHQVAAMEAGEAKDRLIPDVVEDLARKDPLAASEFLKQQESEDAQRRGLNQLMPSWTSQNPTAALAYAKSFPQGDVRDSAIQSWVMSNTTDSPASIMKEAVGIEDEGDRNRSIRVTAARWMREDPTAAKAYVEASTDLSDEAKEQIIEGRGMWGGGGPGGGNRGQGGGRGNRGQGGN